MKGNGCLEPTLAALQRLACIIQSQSCPRSIDPFTILHFHTHV